MKTLCKIVFGSHLYGTDIPGVSDYDFKGIFIPEGHDILLQRASRNQNLNTKKGNDTKNTAEDVDFELFSIQEFLLKLCAKGETIAVDMLFAPRSAWVETSPEWEFIVANREKLIHSGTSAFVGYIMQQSAKYGVKGRNMEAVKAVIDELSKYPQDDKMVKYLSGIKENLKGVKVNWVELPVNGKNNEMAEALDVVNRKLPVYNSIATNMECLNLIYDGYGARAKKAMENDGIDWKSVGHAIRILCEAKEILATGQVTFPRPEAEYLRRIRNGEVAFEEIQKFLEEGIMGLDTIKAGSKLPKTIDVKFWEKWVAGKHLEMVLKETRNGS